MRMETNTTRYEDGSIEFGSVFFDSEKDAVQAGQRIDEITREKLGKTPLWGMDAQIRNLKAFASFAGVSVNMAIVAEIREDARSAGRHFSDCVGCWKLG